VQGVIAGGDVALRNSIEGAEDDEAAGGADLFVHVSVLRDAEALQEGDRVRYKVRQGERGPQADRVERV
jgi:cold shock CspA family protein